MGTGTLSISSPQGQRAWEGVGGRFKPSGTDEAGLAIAHECARSHITELTIGRYQRINVSTYRLTVAYCYKPSGDYRFCCQWVVTCGGGGSRFGPTRIRAPFPRRAGRRGRRPFAFCFTSYGDAGKSLGSRLKPLRRGSGSVDSDSVFRGRTGSPWGMERSQVRTCW